VIVDEDRKTVTNAAGEAVVVEDERTRAEWQAARAALEQDGVRIHVQGPLCNLPGRYACRPILPANATAPGADYRTTITVPREPVERVRPAEPKP
jgi:hypothetical protein